MIIVAGPAGVGKSTVGCAVAAAFDRSVHLKVDDLLASIVSGWVDPNAPEGDAQNWAVGAALAVSAMSFAEHGYTTVVDGTLFPDGAAGLAHACDARGLRCHYVVLMADLDTCWARAHVRGGGRWPLVHEPFVRLHARYADLELGPGRVIDASGTPGDVCGAVLAALLEGRLLMRDEHPAP